MRKKIIEKEITTKELADLIESKFNKFAVFINDSFQKMSDDMSRRFSGLEKRLMSLENRVMALELDMKYVKTGLDFNNSKLNEISDRVEDIEKAVISDYRERLVKLESKVERLMSLKR